MELKTNTADRIVWLDWIKVLAILSIIWGHFFSEGHMYLYVFSVQVFCVISGFLYKKSPNWWICLKKCFWQLFIPTVIMSLMMQLEAYFRCLANGTDYDISWFWFFEWLLLGNRWCMGPCWYFYSLIVMRLIMQAMPEKWWAYVVLFVTMSVGAVCLHYTGIEVSNANTNVLVCMPFFLIGVSLNPLKSALCQLSNFLVEVGIFVVSLLLIILCGHYNGYVWMYLCGFGNSFALYLAGGMAGFMMLYTISLWLSKLPYRSMVLTLSKGSILIIGLHIILVRRLTDLPGRIWIEDLLMAVMILLFFVPVVKLAELFFPLLLGRHR